MALTLGRHVTRASCYLLNMVRCRGLGPLPRTRFLHLHSIVKRERDLLPVHQQTRATEDRIPTYLVSK